MALISKVEEFPENTIWIEYMEHLEHCFTANKITDTSNKRVLITLIVWSKNVEAIYIITNVVLPGKPTNKTFAELANI